MNLFPRKLFVILISLTLLACAQRPVFQLATQPLTVKADVSGLNWYQFSVVWHWPEKSEVDWSLDGLLASQILAPWLLSSELEHLRDKPKLWRFHRRAAKAGGHRFSLLILARAEQTRSLEIWLASHPLWNELQQQGLIDSAVLKPLAQNQLPLLAVGSDPSWPDELQQQWQYYIHGVSRMWLGLIQAKAAEQLLEIDPAVELELDLSQMRILYQKVQKEMDLLWQQEGKHALLHHLNAIFAYRPLVLDQQWIMRF